MEDGIAVKLNALEILEKQLQVKAKKGQYGFVAIGSGTDAYMRHEEEWKLTEGMLNLFLKYRFPVFISTKSTLILRDIELLKQIDKTAMLPDDLRGVIGSRVILSVSISTMNVAISNMLEPGAATPMERLNILQQLKDEGFLTGVNAIPTLPFISDKEEELEKTVNAAKAHGADYILVGGLTLFGKDAADSKTLYFNFLKRYDAALVPEYEKLYGANFFPPTQYLRDLKRRAEKICEKHRMRTTILNPHVETT